jgi:predicted negative regulator of RcsB-dependent stress response
MVEAQEQAKQLDSVTDRVQEKEVDATKAQQAMSMLSPANGSSASGAAGGSHAAYKMYTQQDVQVIVDELEVTSEAAERALRTVAANPTPKMRDEDEPVVVAALRMLVTEAPPTPRW